MRVLIEQENFRRVFMNRLTRLCSGLLPLALAAPAASAQDFVFSAGNFVPNVTAPHPLQPGDTLQINAGGTKLFNGVTFTNLGQVDWNADTLFMQSGARINNDGLWNIGGDFTLNNNGGALPVFTNSGILRKTAGDVAATIGNLGFVNSGVIDVQSGTLDFGGGNATFNAGTSFIGSGTNRILSNATFNGAFSSSNLVLAGGTATGNAAILSGAASYTGGILSGSWSTAAGQTLTARSGTGKIMSGLAFTNLGNFVWDTTDTLFMQSSSTFDNQGRFQANENARIDNNGGALSSFINNGVLAVAADKTLTMGTVAFVNNATIDVEGTLALNGGNATFNAGSTFTGNGVVAVNNNARFNGAITASPTLSLRAGTFTGGDDFSIGGNPEWLGGTMTGQWTLAAGQTLTARSGTGKIMSGLAFTNLGNFVWDTTDTLFMQSSSTFDNQGRFQANENARIDNNGGALPSFINNGVLAVAADKTLTMGAVAFVNNATIDVEGTLALNGNNATFNAGSTFTGNGVVAVNSNASFNGAITASPTLSLRAGTFTGGSDFSIGGNPEWLGGTMTGQWTLAAGQTLTARSGAGKIMSGLAFTNLGSFVWDTTDTLFMQSSSTFDNQGRFQANENARIDNNGGALPSFINNGVLAVAADKTLTMGAVAFVNNATIDVEGTLALNGNNATFNAGSSFTGNGIVAVNSNATFNGAFTSSNLVIAGGTATGNAAILSGAASYTGGILSGSWSTAAGQTLTARSGAGKIMSGITFTNLGTLAWDTTDALFIQSGSQLTNKGTIESKTDHAIAFNGGAAGSFVNEGLIVKSGGSGTTSIGNTLGFVNAASGVIDVQSGTLALPTNFSNGGTLTGTGAFSSNTLTNDGHVAPGGSSGPGTLAISGNFTQTAAGTLDIELGSLFSADLLTVSGITTLGGTLALHCAGACAFDVGDEVTVLNGAGNLLGEFAAIAYFGFGSGEFDVIYDRVNNDVVLRALSATSPVPLPASLWMLLGGLGMLARRARR